MTDIKNVSFEGVKKGSAVVLQEAQGRGSSGSRRRIQAEGMPPELTQKLKSIWMEGMPLESGVDSEGEHLCNIVKR